MNTRSKNARNMIIASFAALTVTAAAPAAYAWHGDDVSIGDITFHDDEDLFEQLVALDPDDVDEIREELTEARAEIRDAIEEIEHAKAEIEGNSAGKTALRAALKIAAGVASRAADRAFERAHDEIKEAEARLEGAEESLGAAEYEETSMAISVISEELAMLEAAVEELFDAMRA